MMEALAKEIARVSIPVFSMKAGYESLKEEILWL
jgi:hypothetical protein